MDLGAEHIISVTVLGSSPPLCHWMDLCSVVLNSTPSCLVIRQLVSSPASQDF